MDKYGFPEQQWENAKTEAKKILAARARQRAMITYSELVFQIKPISFQVNDRRLFAFLDEISREEDAANRGMLSAIVVHKTGDMQPGKGFFKLAKELDKDVKDITKCWVDELKKVYSYWSVKNN